MPFAGMDTPGFPVASFVGLCVEARKLYLPALVELRCDRSDHFQSRGVVVDIVDVLRAAVVALAAGGLALVGQDGRQFVFSPEH